MEFYGKLQAEGGIKSFDPLVLTHHGGDLNGFVMLRSDAIKLSELWEEDTFHDLLRVAGYRVEDFSLVSGFTGECLTLVWPGD